MYEVILEGDVVTRDNPRPKAFQVTIHRLDSWAYTLYTLGKG